MTQFVEVLGNSYRVVLGGSRHAVLPGTTLTCSCAQLCDAIRLVAKWLNSGGLPANLPYSTQGPVVCPICRSPTQEWPGDRDLHRWMCSSGYAHYFVVRGEHLRHANSVVSGIATARLKHIGIVT